MAGNEGILDYPHVPAAWKETQRRIHKRIMEIVEQEEERREACLRDAAATMGPDDILVMHRDGSVYRSRIREDGSRIEFEYDEDDIVFRPAAITDGRQTYQWGDGWMHTPPRYSWPQE